MVAIVTRPLAAAPFDGRVTVTTGDVIEEAESRGEYVIATCSGSAR